MLLSNVVYPKWIEPLLTIDERIAARQKEYDKLAALEEKVDAAKRRYKTLASRAGSLDIRKVETEIRRELNTLIEKHDLQDQKVTPSRPSRDKKTGLGRMMITVTVKGTLQSAIGFLKDVAELPQVVRVENPALYPATKSRKKAGPAGVNLRVPITVLVPPRQRTAGIREDADLVTIESFVRHRNREYARIWQRRPFTEPMPLVANAGKDVSVEEGKPAKLIASATGGEGDYIFSWEPPEGLSDPTKMKPTLDTSMPETRVYMVRVTDAIGEIATDSVKVTIRKSRARPKTPEPKAKTGPAKVVDKRWKDRRYMQLCMALLSKTGRDRRAELMVYNKKLKQTSYYATGDEFNGGNLLFVHPRGGIVRRNNECFIYPIGGFLDAEIRLSDEVADIDYPDLKAIAEQVCVGPGDTQNEVGSASGSSEEDPGQPGAKLHAPGADRKVAKEAEVSLRRTGGKVHRGAAQPGRPQTEEEYARAQRDLKSRRAKKKSRRPLRRTKTEFGGGSGGS